MLEISEPENHMIRTTLSIAALLLAAGISPEAAAMPSHESPAAELPAGETDAAITHAVEPSKKQKKTKKTKKTKKKQKKQATDQHAKEHRRNALRQRARRAWQWNNPPRWAYGVFVHPHHRHGGHASAAAAAPAPQRRVDRAGSLSIGIRGGTYLSAYESKTAGKDAEFGDFGLGVAARARLAEPLGLEVSWANHDETFEEGSARITQPLSASVQLFGMPWAAVSPFALVGVTWTNRNYDDTYFDGVSQQTVQAKDQLFGPHFGLGLEFNVSETTSLNVEAKSISYLNVAQQDPSIPGSVQGTMGLNLHF